MIFTNGPEGILFGTVQYPAGKAIWAAGDLMREKPILKIVSIGFSRAAPQTAVCKLGSAPGVSGGLPAHKGRQLPS